MANNNKITVYTSKEQKELIQKYSELSGYMTTSHYLRDLGVNQYPIFIIEMKGLMKQLKKFLEENENNKRRTSLT